MWTVVYISSNKTTAEQVKTLLSKEGLLVQLRPVGVPHFGDAGSVEVLVPESEAEEAQEILNAFIPV